MDEMYEVLRTTAELSEKALMSPDNLMTMMPSSDYHSLLFAAADHQNRSHHHHHLPMFGSDDVDLASAVSEAGSFTPEFHGGGSGNAGGVGAEVEEGGHVCGAIKARIASHPTFPRLLQAYIDCQKVGAPPEIASFLEEICRDSDLCKRDGVSSCLGVDPELDQFMEVYCDMLVKYKSDLERPFEEANTFLSKIELQLSNLCTDEVEASSDEELSRGEVQVQEEAQRSENRHLKDILLRKFGSHIGTLKLEFSKKKKKGKLPREARQTLLDWWNVHNKWPYPTEADKIALAESTGLDQRQINNWFINQRKRHWKPSESMQFSGMDSISGQFFTDD